MIVLCTAVLIFTIVIFKWLKMSSDESDFVEELKDLQIGDNKRDLNILLIGETGVGKSTFINSVANYLVHKFIDKAERRKLIVLIPSVCRMKDKKKKYHDVQIGSELDKNEDLATGVSATQDVRTYVFPIWNNKLRIRLIDTPGMGDTRGMEQDERNCDNILKYISKIDNLHSICFLLKPTNARKTVFFEYCLTQMLSRFEKSACQNISFIFTNTRGSDYDGGDTQSILENIFGGIAKTSLNISVPLVKNKTIFCFDNEGFRYLAALDKNIEFDDKAVENYRKSWEVSAKQCWSLIRSIRSDNRIPYCPSKFTTIHSARQAMFLLSKVQAHILQKIGDHEVFLPKLQGNQDADVKEIKDLSKKLQVEVTTVAKTKMDEPALVCMNLDCVEVYKVGDEEKLHLKTVCHHKCGEIAPVERDTIGSPSLLECFAINRLTKACIHCGCDFSLHMLVDYSTKLEKINIADPQVDQLIAKKKSLLASSKEIIDDIHRQIGELKGEYNKVQDFGIRLATFLQRNTITSFSSCYKDYIESLISQKQSVGGSWIKSSLGDLKHLLEAHEEYKKCFDMVPKYDEATCLIDLSEEVSEEIITAKFEEFYNFKHNGTLIKDLLKQSSSGERECAVEEYVHEVQFERRPKKTSEDEEKRGNKSGGSYNRGGNSAKENKSDENKDKQKQTYKRNDKPSDWDDSNQQHQRPRTPPPPYFPNGHIRAHPPSDPDPRGYHPVPPAVYNGSNLPCPPYYDQRGDQHLQKRGDGREQREGSRSDDKYEIRVTINKKDTRPPSSRTFHHPAAPPPHPNAYGPSSHHPYYPAPPQYRGPPPPQYRGPPPPQYHGHHPPPQYSGPPAGGYRPPIPPLMSLRPPQVGPPLRIARPGVPPHSSVRRGGGSAERAKPGQNVNARRDGQKGASGRGGHFKAKDRQQKQGKKKDESGSSSKR